MKGGGRASPVPFFLLVAMKKFIPLLLILFLLPSFAFALSGNLTKFVRPSTSNIIKTYPATGTSPAGGLAFTSSSAVSMIGTAAQIGLMMYTGGFGPVASTVLGGLFTAGINLADAYNRGLFNSGPLNDVANSALPSTLPESLTGVKLDCAGQTQCTAGKVALIGNRISHSEVTAGTTAAAAQAYLASKNPNPQFQSNGQYLVYWYNIHVVGSYFYVWQDTYAVGNSNFINGVPDSFVRPATITENSPQEQSLAQKLAQALGLPEVQTALRDAIKSVPEILKDVPTPITNNQVNEYITNNNTYNNDYINYLTDLKNTYQGDTAWIDQAIAEAQKDQSKEEIQQAEQESANAPSLSIPEIKTVNIQPILDLTGDLSGVFPFGLISSFVSGMASLVAEPTPPTLHIDAGIFQKDVDFSVFNGMASFLRGVMSFLLYGLTAFYCVRLFARM